MPTYPTIGGSGGVGGGGVPGGVASGAFNAGGSATPTPGPNGSIGGALNFGSAAGVGDMFNGTLGGLQSGYTAAYQNALQANQTNYNNILAGYQQTYGNQVTAQDAIKSGYTGLYNTVLGGIQGVEASQKQAIQDYYKQAQGASTQGLIDRGLANTTVQDSLSRGLNLDENKANVALANQFAQLQAGYQSNLGLAGLNYQNQASQQNTALNAQQLQWMNSVNAPYPNAGAYGQLAQQYGATQAANADRALQRQYLDRAGGSNFGSSQGRYQIGQSGPSGGGLPGPSSGSVAPSSLSATSSPFVAPNPYSAGTGSVQFGYGKSLSAAGTYRDGANPSYMTEPSYGDATYGQTDPGYAVTDPGQVYGGNGLGAAAGAFADVGGSADPFASYDAGFYGY